MKPGIRAAGLSLVLACLLALPAVAQQKTTKQCNDEWTANRSSLQSSGITKSVFIKECRAGQEPAVSPASHSPASSNAPASGSAGSNSAATAGAGSSMPNAAFTTEAEAKSHCPGDTVVWSNLTSKVYHFTGSRAYGNTKKGAYMCERDAMADGIRAAKNEKHP